MCAFSPQINRFMSDGLPQTRILRYQVPCLRVV